MPPEISIEAMDAQNWEACANLTVTPEQAKYVQSNVFVIARSQFEGLKLHVIRYQAEVAGMYALYLKNGVMWIAHFMLDAHRQHMQIGSQVLNTLLEQFRLQQEVKEVRVSVMRDNIEGAYFYVRAGFQILGVYPDGEQVFQYALRSDQSK
jgi:ribosomal protein S18 acetylase RimI-like enzyme